MRNEQVNKKIVDQEKIFKPIKTPTVLQMEATECGAAALAIIMHHYGCKVPLEKLRVDCGVSREGSKVKNIIQAAQNYDLICESYQVDELEDLYHINPPAILFWDFNHFVVFEGINSKKVYINDPAIGRRNITWDEFGKSFTGLVIGIKPNDHFKFIKTKDPLWKIFSVQLSQYRYFFAFTLLSLLFLVIPGILLPVFSKVFVDEILIKDNINWLGALILGMIFTALVRNILTWFQMKSLLKYKAKFLAENSAELFWKMLYLPLQFFQQRFIGDICYRAQAFQRIGDLLSVRLTASIIKLLLVFFYLAFIFLYSIEIGFILVALISMVVVTFIKTQRKLRDYSFEYLQLSGQMNGIQTQGVQVVEMIKATNEYQLFFNNWANLHAKKASKQQMLITSSQLSSITINAFASLANVCILSFGAWLIMNGELTPGSLIAIQTLSMSIFEPIIFLFSIGQEIEKIRGDITRINDVAQYQPEKPIHSNTTQDTSEITPQTITESDLVLNKVNFQYNKFDPYIVSDCFLSIKKGKKISLVGPSGSGKSTIAKIIVRLLQPTSGSITFNNSELNSIDSEDFKYKIGYVDQEIFLFEGSLRDNLCLWKTIFEDEDLLLALDDVGMFNYVVENGGLDFYITEGGSNLSQGQKQRIEIARALLYQPDIIILDEATSALDVENERAIYQILSKRGIGILAIAHRLSAIQDSDHIYVIDKGRIVESGTHVELMHNDSIYTRPYKNESY